MQEIPCIYAFFMIKFKGRKKNTRNDTCEGA